MRSDQDRSGKAVRGNSSMPLPGMPYGRRPEPEEEASASRKQKYEFIEANPMPGQYTDAARTFNSWRDQGWEAGSTEPVEPAAPDYGFPPEEPYPDHGFPAEEPYSDSYGQPPEYPDSYEPYEESVRYEPFTEYPQERPYSEPPVHSEPASYFDTNPYPPPPPDTDTLEEELPPVSLPPPEPRRVTEPWRIAVVLFCIAGLIFCAADIFRIAQDVMHSDAELSEYREDYLKKYNVDFTHNAEAVALRPAGETYPPTATPVPVQTPTPTPRINVEDPLVAAMSAGGMEAGQTVAPSTPTPEGRTLLERYPENPLCVMREEIAALQQENTDIVGRLLITGLMDEIVVQRNNTYYLNHNVWGESSVYSAVFADESVSFRPPPENILLFGRTSNAGREFAPLKSYITEGFDFAQRHAFLSFNSLYEEARYVIVAVIQGSSDPSSVKYFDYKKMNFSADSAMLTYMQNAKSRSLYNFNVPVAASDRLLTLVTLSDSADSENLIIICRKLRDGESDGVIQPQ